MKPTAIYQEFEHVAEELRIRALAELVPSQIYLKPVIREILETKDNSLQRATLK